MAIDSSGNVLVGITTARANAGDVQVSKGISFPATQSAQSDANTLDDYEEGTWTPSVSYSTSNGNLSLGIQVGRYTKIGNVVSVVAYVLWDETTASGNVSITGLPFTTLNVTNLVAGYSFFVDNMTGLSGGVAASLSPNATSFNLFYSGTGTQTNITAANTSASSNVARFTFSYFTA
jgi:hypothetical protein